MLSLTSDVTYVYFINRKKSQAKVFNNKNTDKAKKLDYTRLFHKLPHIHHQLNHLSIKFGDDVNVLCVSFRRDVISLDVIKAALVLVGSNSGFGTAHFMVYLAKLT